MLIIVKNAGWVADGTWQGSRGIVMGDVNIKMRSQAGDCDIVSFEVNVVSGIESDGADG